MHEVLVNRLGGLSLPRKSVVRLTDRPDMTLDVYRGRKTTMQQQPYDFIFDIKTTSLLRLILGHPKVLMDGFYGILASWQILIFSFHFLC